MQLYQCMWLSGVLCMILVGYTYIVLVGITKLGLRFAVSWSWMISVIAFSYKKAYMEAEQRLGTEITSFDEQEYLESMFLEPCQYPQVWYFFQYQLECIFFFQTFPCALFTCLPQLFISLVSQLNEVFVPPWFGKIEFVSHWKCGSASIFGVFLPKQFWHKVKSATCFTSVLYKKIDFFFLLAFDDYYM